MNEQYAVGDQVWHLANGEDRTATVIALAQGNTTRVRWNDSHHVFDAVTKNLRPVEMLRWRDVEPGDTVEFEVQGDTLSIKAQGFGTQVTVLGWRTTEVESIWDLRSIKKRNPDMPNKIGARIRYRDSEWLLVTGAMTGPRLDDYSKIWVKIDDSTFDWCDQPDPDREVFEVLSHG
jgi:hypothetical protein